MTLLGAPPSRPDHRSMTARYRGGRQAVEYAILRARRHKDKAQAETLLTRTTGGSGMSVTQRLAAGARRLISAGQGHQVEDRGVPTQELKLELSQSKTLITHVTSQAARFLG